MDRWYKLGQSGAKAALKYRVDRSLGFDEPCDVFQTIANEKVDLQFVDIPSLEGMFLQEPEVRRICVCALRPWGRQRYTAAHELGHCILGHGTQVDTVIETRDRQPSLSDEEILAEAFSRFVLMPPRAVAKAFGKRLQYDARAVLEASCWLGVGYGTLIRQMCSTLRLISESEQETLLRVKRRELCRNISGIPDLENDLWPLDERWRDRRVHVQLGDVIQGVCSKGSGLLSPIDSTVNRVECVGTETVDLISGGSVTISSSRRSFVGFYDYRYMPE
jgi:IrrE N-terminal-like domain